MKAIIMAGGKGTRLKPLTCAKPKPMVYLANNPVMTHTIELLKKHDITEIGVTIQYMASQITDYYGEGKEYGVNLSYFIEEIPLGTAGSVKNAQKFLDDTFLVISGDGLTDINISQAIEFHKAKNSLVTLILTSVDNPLEYGIVVTKENGEIVRFLEKPSWGEVFSDQINTGIYIIEPEILNYIPDKIFYDFSKDLFPSLMKRGIILNGFSGTGYWCDIGNCQAYLQAHLDILTEKVAAYLPYQEQLPKIWVGENTEIHPTARLEAPVVIGSNSYIGPSALIGPHTFIGNNCIINEHASLKRSVLWNGVQIGKETTIRGAVLCSNVNIKQATAIYEGAIIGQEAILNEKCTIKPAVKIWPNKTLEEGSVLKGNLVWGNNFSKSLFGCNGIKGQLNADLYLDQILQIGTAFGSSITNLSGNIGISSDGTAVAKTVKQALTSGMQIVGQQIYDLGEITLPICRFTVNNGNLAGGIHIQFCSEDDLVHITFLNEQGANISKALEKKIENSLSVHDFRYVPQEKIKDVQALQNIYELYFASLKNLFQDQLDLEVVLTCPSPKLKQSIGNLLEDLNCRVKLVNEKEFLEYLSADKNKKLALKFDHQAEKITLFTEDGKMVEGDRLKVLISHILFTNYREMLLVASIEDSAVLEELAQKHGSKVLRCKTDLSSRMENMLKQGKYGVKQFFMEFDGLYAALHIFDFLNNQGLSLSQVINELPQFYIYKELLSCPWETKGKIIRTLLENFSEDSYESIEGAKFKHPKGNILVLPDSEKPLVNLITESTMMEAAQDISENYREKIQHLISHNS
ncbi:MAG: sugar phosphate nucleotidyltransferase [Peptococcaceae bacterium]